ncbi:MAG: hypothetical protein VXZ51_07015, partial [Actinomycetota bacterium]|nr:hypothetical protein [Actinomycetota bacterium]
SGIPVSRYPRKTLEKAIQFTPGGDSGIPGIPGFRISMPKREKGGEEKGRKGRERKVVWDHTIIYGHR